MINDLLNIVFFAAFSLNASFLCVSVIEVIFLTANFNQKFSSTCCAYRVNDYFCLPLLTLVVTSNSDIGGGRNTPVLMLTLVFLNFLRFYCLRRSLESLYVSFPVLLNLFRSQLVVIHTAIDLFQKYHDTVCFPSKILHQHCFQFLLGRKAYCLLIHLPVLLSICQVGLFF